MQNHKTQSKGKKNKNKNKKKPFIYLIYKLALILFIKKPIILK
jgi:hypothetical protein